VTRLIDMGVEPYLVASSLEAALAQRLVRVLCERCKQEDRSAKAVAVREQIDFPPDRPLYEAVGCEACRQTGYHGRRAVFELMDMNDDIRQLVLRSSATGDIRKAAQRTGMPTLNEDGWRIVAEGATTVDEVLRVTKAGRVNGAGGLNGS
jgi:type II secretory ATPase GspE/PulE/Tfp pilus assembly ATPase PilB-like protein